MSDYSPFMTDPPGDRLRPFRVVSDGVRSNGLALGDTKIGVGVPGPAKHVHTHEDEALYVVSGLLTVEVGEERYEAGPESYVFLPRGVPHVFGNLGSQDVHAVVLFNSLTLAQMFAEQAEYRASVDGPPHPEVLTEISRRYGVEPLGGPLQPA